MDTSEKIKNMSPERVKKNKEFIEYYNLEFAPDFRKEYLLYCKAVEGTLI